MLAALFCRLFFIQHTNLTQQRKLATLFNGSTYTLLESKWFETFHSIIETFILKEKSTRTVHSIHSYRTLFMQTTLYVVLCCVSLSVCIVCWCARLFIFIFYFYFFSFLSFYRLFDSLSLGVHNILCMCICIKFQWFYINSKIVINV